jgi:hypothetical protein
MADNMYLPDFLLIGAAKSGTTAIYNQLKQHQSIQLSQFKEPAFFFYDGTPESERPHPVTGQLRTRLCFNREQYRQQFSHADTTVVRGEASTDYLPNHDICIPKILELYKIYNKELPKIICILRNPVERAWSQYSMHVQSGIESLEFFEAIQEDTLNMRLAAGWPPSFNYLRYGEYYNHLAAWKDVFPYFLPLSYNDYNNDQALVLRSITDFIGVDPLKNLDLSKKHNAGGSQIGAAGALRALLVRPNALKRWVKPALPIKFRIQLKNQLLAKLSTRSQACPLSVQKFLENYYDSSICSTRKEYLVDL